MPVRIGGYYLAGSVKPLHLIRRQAPANGPNALILGECIFSPTPAQHWRILDWRANEYQEPNSSIRQGKEIVDGYLSTTCGGESQLQARYLTAKGRTRSCSRGNRRVDKSSPRARSARTGFSPGPLFDVIQCGGNQLVVLPLPSMRNIRAVARHYTGKLPLLCKDASKRHT
jgi:hypothetical protein